MTIREYTLEIGSELNDGHFRIERVKAGSAVSAMRLCPRLLPDEYLYQICRNFSDCELAQPVYDYINGFELYAEQDKRETWREE